MLSRLNTKIELMNKTEKISFTDSRIVKRFTYTSIYIYMKNVSVFASRVNHTSVVFTPRMNHTSVKTTTTFIADT